MSIDVTTCIKFQHLRKWPQVVEQNLSIVSFANAAEPKCGKLPENVRETCRFVTLTCYKINDNGNHRNLEARNLTKLVKELALVVLVCLGVNSGVTNVFVITACQPSNATANYIFHAFTTTSIAMLFTAI